MSNKYCCRINHVKVFHMKPFFVSRLALLLGLLLWALPSIGFSQLVLSTLVDDLPSAVMAQKVLIEAYRQLGVKIIFEKTPNSRGRSLLDARLIDGVAFRIVDSEVSDLKKIPVPINYEELVVFAVNKRFKVRGYTSLSSYSIGYLDGARIIEDRLKDMRLEAAPSTESLFKKLVAGRTDIVVHARSSFCTARQLGLTDIEMLSPSLEKIVGYHWLSARHAALIPKLGSVLNKMRRDGSIKKIQDEVMRDFNARCAG